MKSAVLCNYALARGSYLMFRYEPLALAPCALYVHICRVRSCAGDRQLQQPVVGRNFQLIRLKGTDPLRRPA